MSLSPPSGRTDERRRVDAGQDRDAFEQPIVERYLLLRRRVGSRGGQHRADEHAIRREAEIESLERDERSQQQAAADEQDQRHRDLENDQRSARAVADRCASAPSAILERRRHVRPRRLQRWDETEHQAGEESQRGGKREHRAIETDLSISDAGRALRRDRHERVDAPEGEHDARAPPTTASSRLSVRSCRMSRRRPAPSASRTAISRVRPTRERAGGWRCSRTRSAARSSPRRAARAGPDECRQPPAGAAGPG